MKRQHSGGLRTPKRRKLQMSIRSMFLNNGPKFTESVGIQPTCRYCGRKFKAAQGLSNATGHQNARRISAGFVFFSCESLSILEKLRR